MFEPSIESITAELLFIFLNPVERFSKVALKEYPCFITFSGFIAGRPSPSSPNDAGIPLLSNSLLMDS